MANKKQGPMMMIVLVAAIAVALFFIVREVRPRPWQPPYPKGNWACLECGYEFVASLPGPLEPVKCPRDEGRTAQILYYKCGLCGLRFEAYRLKADAEARAAFFQVPGGAWVRGGEGEEPRVVCPGGCADPEALRFSPPES